MAHRDKVYKVVFIMLEEPEKWSYDRIMEDWKYRFTYDGFHFTVSLKHKLSYSLDIFTIIDGKEYHGIESYSETGLLNGDIEKMWEMLNNPREQEKEQNRVRITRAFNKYLEEQ